MKLDKNCFAMMELALRWQCENATHVEKFLARKVNMWRDVFPSKVRDAIMGMEKGETRTIELEAGRLRGAYREDKIVSAMLSEFRPKRVGNRDIVPQLGRHYPLGLLAKPGIDRYDMRAFRLTELQERSLVADQNHPLARYPLSVDVTALDIAPKEGDVGGRAYAWMEELCDGGPGMQARVPGKKTDFFLPNAFGRPDESEDAGFYDAPRLINHIDNQASAIIAEAYAQQLSPGEKVLDLMSSFQSHLPDIELDVTGLGLVAEEMQANPQLGRHVVHDLNRDPRLPFGDGEFDAVICSLSIEYLIDPETVLTEIVRILRPGGKILVSFSNRWFPSKVTNVWPDLHEFERMGFVVELLLRNGCFKGIETLSARNWWRPSDDRHYDTRNPESWNGDPVYVVSACSSGA